EIQQDPCRFSIAKLRRAGLNETMSKEVILGKARCRGTSSREVLDPIIRINRGLTMNRSTSIVWLLVMSVPAALLHSAQFKFENQTFTVPDGFEVELVAGPPLVNRPIEADFDERG